MTKAPDLHLSPGPAPVPVDYAPLVRAAAAGDRPAMERLLMRAQEVAFRYGVMVCGRGADAEDVMQEALLRTYRHVSRIRDPGAFRTWLYRTVRNACLMKRRRRVDEPAHLVPIDDPGREGGSAADVPDRAKRPDQAALDNWLGARLRTALAALPPGYRVIVLLREMDGLSTREVARITGLSEANVKTRLHRARQMLRDRLDDVKLDDGKLEDVKLEDVKEDA